MRGRKPKPVEERIREGNAGRRTLPEPMLVAGRPELGVFARPPSYLPPMAKRFWGDFVSRLVEVGCVDQVDRPALEGLATLYARARQAGEEIRRNGRLLGYGSMGQLVEHPAVRVERQSWKQFYAMCEHFALTPIARTRLGLAELHRRSLADEMRDALGTPELQPVVDAEVVA